ncbi:MAG: cob(I)yrinic acid a,c-diamide adenosyltransferase [Planctomycetota bacterium]
MAKLYTRKGDDGKTGLLGGGRVPKDDARVEAYGTVDELNAQLGVAASLLDGSSDTTEQEALRDRLRVIQGQLFEIGAELARPTTPGRKQKKTPAIPSDRISRLESWIDEADTLVPPLKRFILPGGNRLAAHLHVCRAACRRAERRVVTLARACTGRQAASGTPRETIDPQVLIYLNRLGDLLFAWARLANHLTGCAEQTWPEGDD